MIRPEAVSAFWSLSTALAEVDGLVPCRNRAGELYADDRRVRADVTAICSTCPVLRLCGDFADANKETHGVWGGTDRTTHPGTRKKDVA